MPHSGVSLALAFGFVLASWLAPGYASACSPVFGTPQAMDPELRAVDTTAPNLAPLGDVSVQRGRAPLAGEVVCAGNFGRISIGVQATDDMTPAEQIGYHLSLVSGTPPDGLILPTPFLAAGQSVSVPWDDGASADQEPFDMTLSVVAIDRAGNRSAPQTVHVQDPGGDIITCLTQRASTYMIDPALAATDQIAPNLPPLVAEVTRGHAQPPGACGTGAIYTCDNVGSITVTNLATDDQTPAFFIGYRFAVVEGRLPQWLNLPAETLSVPIRHERFALQWHDGTVEEQEPIDVTLQIVAVDQAGNESSPQTLRITDPGNGGGCRIGGHRSSSLAIITVALIAFTIASRRRRRALVFGGALALWLAPNFARACDLRGNTPHVLDPAMRGIDSQAPVLSPIDDVFSIGRGNEPDRPGCFGMNVICGEDLGSIQILVEATDDMTPADRIGFRVMVVDGTPPAGFVAPGPIRGNGLLFVDWVDGATGDQEPFDMTLSVAAIDLAGNESPPQTVRVRHPGSGGGCRIGGRRSSDAGTVVIALLALTVAGRRRRLATR